LQSAFSDPKNVKIFSFLISVGGEKCEKVRRKVFSKPPTRGQNQDVAGFHKTFGQNVNHIVEPLPKKADSRHFTPKPKRNCIGSAFVELSATVTASS